MFYHLQLRMRKLVAFSVVIFACLISCGSLANESESLHNYIERNFPKHLQISDAQVEQLSWIIGHKKRSYDMDAYVLDPNVHIEIVRALTRLYCFQLLKSGTQQDYLNFIAAQMDAKVSSPLTFNSFKKLSRHIQRLNSVDHELLETATILSAVSLSDHAYKLAQGLVNIDNSANDNLAFLTTTVRIEEDIYPLIKQISSDHQMAKKMLYILFPPQTNFRHMLYTEGGVSMFKYLRSMINHQYLSAEEMNLWYAHWVINISGFRGHVSHDGSLYLTEPVFQSMDKLFVLTKEMLQIPNFNPLIPYLEYRADLLGYNTLPDEQRLFLAHLGAMLRFYNSEQGKKLYDAFYKLPASLRKELQSQYFRDMNDYQSNAATYFPALLNNMMQYSSGDINLTLKIALPLYITAREQYSKMIKSCALQPGTVISFNELSAQKNIIKLVGSDSDNPCQIVISGTGEVLIN